MIFGVIFYGVICKDQTHIYILGQFMRTGISLPTDKKLFIRSIVACFVILPFVFLGAPHVTASGTVTAVTDAASGAADAVTGAAADAAGAVTEAVGAGTDAVTGAVGDLGGIIQEKTGIDVNAKPCCSCQASIPIDYLGLMQSVNGHTTEQFVEVHRKWLITDFFKGQILPAMMMFTEQMSAVAMHQTMIIGTFFDAKHQLETQRTLQEMQNQAHKDYQPSEDFCQFGTNVRSLSNSETRGRFNALLLSRRQMARHLGQGDINGSSSQDQDKEGRWRQFVAYFCDPNDNNRTASNPATGLGLVCPSGPADPAFANADVDYTRLVENQRTLSLESGGNLPFDLDKGSIATGGEFGGTSGTLTPISKTEQAIMGLANNLYGHDVLSRRASGNQLKIESKAHLYLALRSVAAKRSVAENSFNAIVGMKSGGTTSRAIDNAAGSGFTGGDPTETWKFLGAIMKELGVPDDEIMDVIGKQPSYYAQLELLAKKMYQTPSFYAGLYDKPVNVKRKSVALKAIDLMLDRAIYESQIRQEMATSVLLSSRLREPFKEANRGLQTE